MIAPHMIASLLAGRWASLAEVGARALALASPDPEAVQDDGDDFERIADIEARLGVPVRSARLDPLHLLEDFEVIDHRDVPDEKRPARGRSVGIRPASDVMALCGHQTAAAGLGPRHPKVLAVPAHALVGRDGTIVLLHRVTAYVYHGHGWNRDTIGIELQARAAGLEGRARTFWRSRGEKRRGRTHEQLAAEATPEQIRAFKALCRYYAALMAARGAPLQAVVTHRQSARKPSDPGQRIALALNEVAAELELPRDWTAKVRGRGRPQPDEWVLVPRGIRYWGKAA